MKLEDINDVFERILFCDKFEWRQFREPSGIPGDPLLKYYQVFDNSLIHNNHFYIYKQLITYSIFIESEWNIYSKSLCHTTGKKTSWSSSLTYASWIPCIYCLKGNSSLTGGPWGFCFLDYKKHVTFFKD